MRLTRSAHSRLVHRPGHSTDRYNTRLDIPAGPARRSSRSVAAVRHNRPCDTVSGCCDATRGWHNARFVIIGIALLLVLPLAAGIVVVLPVLVVVVVPVLALLGVCLILAVAIIVVASLRMSGHRGKRLSGVGEPVRQLSTD
jgi:hypothetical protein